MERKKLESLLVKVSTNIKEAMQKLDETAERILFVIDEKGRLLGTITDGDIRRGIMHGLSFQSSIDTIMHKEFASVIGDSKDATNSAKSIMLKDKLEQIPVVDSDGVIRDVILWMDMLGKQPPAPPIIRSYPNRVVIMAGGKGARLDPFTRILPKPLIPIGDKTIVELIMEKYARCGFSDFVYTLNYKKEYIKIFLRENNFPYKIDWIEESEYLGTAGSLSMLKEKVGETFFVSNCDSLLDADFEQVLKWHKQYGAAITVIGSHSEVKIPFGVIEMSDGRLKKITEKPVHDMVINTGVYVLEPRIISHIPAGKKMDMNELIDLVAKKDKVIVYTIFNGWFDIGQWEEYKKSVEKLQLFV